MFSMSSLARSPCASWRGALALSDMSHDDCHRMEFTWDLGPMIWRIQKRRQRCRRRCSKACFRNPLRRSVNEYELEPRHLPDFLSAFWAKVQVSPYTSFLVNTRLLSLKSSSNSIVTVRKWLPKFLLGRTEAAECAGSFRQSLQSLNMHASIKNMTSSSQRYKNSWIAKWLSSDFRTLGSNPAVISVLLQATFWCYFNRFSFPPICLPSTPPHMMCDGNSGLCHPSS